MTFGRPESANRPYSLGTILTAVFLFALFMGAGPGLHLVNPSPADPEPVFTVGGLPVIYLWALFWYGVELAVILTAYFTMWRKESD